MTGDEKEEGPMMAKIIQMLEDAKKEQKQMEEQFNSSFKFTHSKIDDRMKIIEEQSRKIDTYHIHVEKLSQENFELKKTVNLLEMKLHCAKQYNRSNTIEIFGVPQVANETTYEIVKNISAFLDLKIERDQVDVCHRLRPKGNVERQASITARFVRERSKSKLRKKGM